jgi:hypothetical protein
VDHEEAEGDASAAALARAMEHRGRPGATALGASAEQREALADSKRMGRPAGGGARWEAAGQLDGGLDAWSRGGGKEEDAVTWASTEAAAARLRRGRRPTCGMLFH